MKIFVLGNPDLAGDDIAQRILPRLKKQFPNIGFKHIDPLEGFGENLMCRTSDLPAGRQAIVRMYDKSLNDPKEGIVIIDAVKGISKVTLFNNLNRFTAAHRRMTMHDFDLYDELILLQKLKKLPKIAIIGIPWGVSEKDIWNNLAKIIQSI